MKNNNKQTPEKLTISEIIEIVKEEFELLHEQLETIVNKQTFYEVRKGLIALKLLIKANKEQANKKKELWKVYKAFDKTIWNLHEIRDLSQEDYLTWFDENIYDLQKIILEIL